MASYWALLFYHKRQFVMVGFALSLPISNRCLPTHCHGESCPPTVANGRRATPSIVLLQICRRTRLGGSTSTLLYMQCIIAVVKPLIDYHESFVIQVLHRCSNNDGYVNKDLLCDAFDKVCTIRKQYSLCIIIKVAISPL